MDNRHYAVVDSYKRKVTAKYKNQVLVETENASILKEVGKSVYDPVFYFPKNDFLVQLKQEEDRTSSCPIKGEATYWNLEDEPTLDYFAWSYEEPLPRSRKIEGLIALNPSLVTICTEPLH